MQPGRISGFLHARTIELWRWARPVLARARQTALERAADARARLGPWLRHERRVAHARLRLWRAALAYEASLAAARLARARARREYLRRCRQAARAAAAEEKEATRAVSQATGRFREICRPRRLAGYGPYTLLDNALAGPDWEVSLRSVRAVLLPPDAVALRGAGTRAFPVPAAEVAPRRGRLVIRSRRGLSAHDCRGDDARAGEFAELVNVAALNPSRFEETRRDDVQQAADHLEAVRATAAQRIAAARAAAEAARADTSGVEDAERALARAAAETHERDRRRAELLAAKNAPR